MRHSVVFQKWRWTEIAVTLGLIFVAFSRKEWPMTFIAVIPSVGSGRYAPGPNMAVSSVLTC